MKQKNGILLRRGGVMVAMAMMVVISLPFFDAGDAFCEDCSFYYTVVV